MAHMLGPGSMGWNLYGPVPVYQSEVKLGSGPGPIYESAPKIGSRPNFSLVGTFG